MTDPPTAELAVPESGRHRREGVSIARDLGRSLSALLRQFRTEMGGVLLGRRDEQDVVISAAVFPRQQMSSAIGCSFDTRAIDVVHEALAGAAAERISAALTVVGWVHSHPRLGVFLSDQDVETLALWTDLDPEALAMVVDPFSRKRSIAVWGREGSQRSILQTGSGTGLNFDEGASLGRHLRAPGGEQENSLWFVVCAEGFLGVPAAATEVVTDR